MFMVLSSWHSNCQSSKGSFDNSTNWLLILRSSQSACATHPTIGRSSNGKSRKDATD